MAPNLYLIDFLIILYNIEYIRGLRYKIKSWKIYYLTFFQVQMTYYIQNWKVNGHIRNF